MSGPQPPAPFGFATAGDVRFGRGRVTEAAPALLALGARSVAVVTGRSARHVGPVVEALDAAGTGCVLLAVDGEPTVDAVRAAVAVARDRHVDAVLGIGGGSVLDTAKAVALLAATGTDPLDHLEVVGRGLPVGTPALPWVAVPTTAGTGSEVTRNAVLSAAGPSGPVKASLRHASMLARVAIVDPDLLVGLPRDVVAASGLDALSQNVEAFLSVRANPVTDALAGEGIRRGAVALAAVAGDGHDAGHDDGHDAGHDDLGRALRGPVGDDLALASLLSGLALANAGLGAVHAVAAALGASLRAPHGAVCGATLPAALAVTLEAATAAGADAVVDRLRRVAVLLTGDERARPQDGAAHAAALRERLGVPGLFGLGLRPDDVPPAAADALAASSMRANPLPLSAAQVEDLLHRAG